MEALMYFVENGLPFALKADNGKYVQVGDKLGRVYANAKAIEPQCQFYAERKGDRIRLLSGGRVLHRYADYFGRTPWDLSQAGALTRLLETSDRAATGFITPNSVDDETTIVLRADDGTFYARTDSSDVFAPKEKGVKDKCKFVVVDGALVPPKIDILEVTWDTSNVPEYKPHIVGDKVIKNGGAGTLKDTVAFEWEQTDTETITWEYTLEAGFQFEYSAGAKVQGVGIDKKLTFHVTGTIKRSKTNEKTSRRTVKQQTEVEVPKGNNVKVSLMVKRCPNARLPFTAKIRRTDDGKSKVIYLKGVWSGALYESYYFEVKPLEGETPSAGDPKPRDALDNFLQAAGDLAKNVLK